MGKKRKTVTEVENQTIEETDAGRGETNVSEPTSPPAIEEQSSTLPRLATLKAILIGIDAPPQIWPKEALKATLRKFERMPRKGWDLLLQTYNEKFALKISLSELRRGAETAVVSNNGRKCSRQIFTEESSKRPKSILDFVEENTLRDLKLYIKAKEQLRKELGSIKAMKVEEVQRTKKIYSESQDAMILDLLNQAVGETIQITPIKTWNDIAHMIQAVQLAYASLTFKAHTKSTWKENIINKIENAIKYRDTLCNARDCRELPKEEVKKGRKIMRELGLTLERKDDIIEAISKLNEKAALY